MPYTRIVVRAHQFTVNGPADGQRVGDIENLHPAFSVERVVRRGQVIELDTDFILQADDIVGVYALREAVGALALWVGPEIDHPELLSFATRTADVVLTSAHLSSKTIHEIKKRLITGEHPGCFVNTITRQGLALPMLPNTVLRTT